MNEVIILFVNRQVTTELSDDECEMLRNAWCDPDIPTYIADTESGQAILLNFEHILMIQITPESDSETPSENEQEGGDSGGNLNEK